MKRNQMNPERAKAEREWKQAAYNVNNCPNTITENEWNQLNEILVQKRNALIALEKQYPTQDEIKRADERFYFASRGLDY